MPQHGLVIAGKANLEERPPDRTLLQFAEEHLRFRSRLRELWAQRFHQLGVTSADAVETSICA
jgi:hypothetical protein